MKSHAVTAVLNGVLAVSVLLCAIFSIQYVFLARQLRSLTLQAVTINNTHTGLQALVRDCVDYSQTNPAINPVLESFGLKQPKATPAAATKPAAK